MARETSLKQYCYTLVVALAAIDIFFKLGRWATNSNPLPYDPPFELSKPPGVAFVRPGDLDTHWRRYRSCPYNIREAVHFDKRDGMFFPVCSSSNAVVWEARTPRPATTVFIARPGHTSSELLMAVRKRDPGKGMLDFPGGFMKPGETVLDGAMREVHEEFGGRAVACKIFAPEGVAELY
eukprot:Sspe_Gene.93207::Locus_65896_Transcript_1_3_Confidence_0.400_Length_592::g.93207::m.93207